MRKTLLLLLLAGIAISVSAQEEPPSRKGKFFLIPEVWMSFGTSTYIEVAPMLGYQVLERLSVGLGPHYIYQSVKASPYNPYSYQTHSYGLKGFARFSLITNAEEFLPIKLFSELFVQTEYEGLSMDRAIYVSPSADGERIIYKGFLVGGGISQRVGMFNTISFTVLWNINESIYSPYSNPIFRISFNAYF